MIAGCKSMMYDMPDMMQHIKKDHDMTPRQYMDLYRKLVCFIPGTKFYSSSLPLLTSAV
jgi:hypothetical protein